MENYEDIITVIDHPTAGVLRKRVRVFKNAKGEEITREFMSRVDENGEDIPQTPPEN